MITKLVKTAGVIAALLLSTSGWAAPVTYLLDARDLLSDPSNAKVNIVGSFVYDSSPAEKEPMFTAINITVTSLSDFLQDFQFESLGTSNSSSLSINGTFLSPKSRDQGKLVLNFAEPLGSTSIGLENSSYIENTVANEAENLDAAFELQGNVTLKTVGVVPVPAAAWLFGSALGLLGWLKRRR